MTNFTILLEYGYEFTNFDVWKLDRNDMLYLYNSSPRVVEMDNE